MGLFDACRTYPTRQNWCSTVERVATMSDEKKSLLAYFEAMDDRSKKHILGLSRRLAQKFPVLQRPVLRLVRSKLVK